jgi:anti-sigma factor ChrR (cupin superfamily)
MNTKPTEKDNDLRLNMDFAKPARMLPGDYDWQASPADGVARVPLERMAAESGHKTSFVQFSPESYFPAHTRTGAARRLS